MSSTKAGGGERFQLGQLFATANAAASLPSDEVWAAVLRHASGDWGEVCKEDWAANEAALVEGYRLFSVYRSADGRKFWIITEADRSSTTILLPEDY
jgi:hypothetical protein